MKKIYALSSALLIAALGTTSVMADTFTVGDLQYSTIDDNTCAVSKSFSAGDLVIPSKVTNEETGNEYTVVKINSSVFRRSSITSCVIPGTITNPGPTLFVWCGSLTSVTFEEGVEELGYNTFQNCANIVTVNLPESLKVLGGEDAYGFSTGSAFQGCGKIETLVIPAGITEIPDNTFNGCESLKNLTFEGEITTIGDNAFNNCKALTDLSFPAVTKIGSAAFNYCEGLKTIELGGTLENLPNETFYGCSGLEDVVLGEGIKTIGVRAFNNCSALKAISFPASVTEINESAFNGCTAIASVFCASEVPPTAAENAFPDAVYANATLSVPDTAEEAYATAACWSKFENRQGVSVGVNEIADNAVAVKAVAGGIVIEGTDAVAEIFNVSGQMAARTAAREIQLPAGLYIVRVAGITAKTLVK